VLITPPGIEVNAVGIEAVVVIVTIDAIKKVKIIGRGIPIITKTAVTGTITDVSSVPGIIPTIVYKNVARMAPRAI
jgi:hypothetical protein